MNARISKLHRTNVKLFSNYRDLEGKLLDSLQEFDSHRGFEAMGFNSLYEYCLKSLGMSENQAYSFIRVSRKSVEIPALKEAVKQKEITISSAKVIASVITKENQETLLEQARTLPKRDLEREIVKINPKAIIADRMIPINATQSQGSGVFSEEARRILKRVKELESKRTSDTCDMDTAIIAMGKLYLQKNDPIERAQRNKKENKDKDNCPQVHGPSKRTRTIPAKITHQVNLRDQGTCRVVGCGSRHYTHAHHIRPYALGGTHRLENLITLCSAHHRAIHNGVRLEFDLIL